MKFPFTVPAILLATTVLAQEPQPADRPAVPALRTLPAVPPVPAVPGAPGADSNLETPVAVPAPPRSAAGGRAATRKRVEIVAGEGAKAGGGLVLADELDRTSQMLEDLTILPRTTKTGRTLVVQSTEQDPAALSNAEEDLSVMALILRKATGAERRVAMGIELDSSVFGSTSGARNIYIEGYGALFLLGVRYPLIAPTENTTDKEPKESVSNEWTDAREEYLGANRAKFQIALDAQRAGRFAREQYQPEKVEELKTALLQALKNASHIRVLKPTDFVTIVIQGGEANRPDKVVTKASTNGRNRSETRPAETVMTIRVKAADIQAFAKAEVDLDALRRRAVIQTYFRRPDSSIGTAAFIGPSVGQ